jgi:hypothetical protein
MRRWNTVALGEEQDAGENIWTKGREMNRNIEYVNEGLYNLCSSPDIIRIIKWRSLQWAGYLSLQTPPTPNVPTKNQGETTK